MKCQQNLVARNQSASFVPFSSSGEILMPGIWIDQGNFTIGSSYAAPRLSFLLAHYLVHVEDVCRNTGLFAHSNTHIRLAYAPIFALNEYEYRDYVFGDVPITATPQICPEFLSTISQTVPLP